MSDKKQNIFLTQKVNQQIYLGADFRNFKDDFRCEIILLQEGDIPALIFVNLDGFFIELSCLDNIVYSIKIPFTYEKNKVALRLTQGELFLQKHTDFLSFLKFLDSNLISWDIDKSSGDRSVVLMVQGNILVEFVFEPDYFYLLAILQQDIEIYKKIAGKE
jgi:hypothetical protein